MRLCRSRRPLRGLQGREALPRFLTERGKILPSRLSGITRPAPAPAQRRHQAGALPGPASLHQRGTRLTRRGSPASGGDVAGAAPRLRPTCCCSRPCSCSGRSPGCSWPRGPLPSGSGPGSARRGCGWRVSLAQPGGLARPDAARVGAVCDWGLRRAHACRAAVASFHGALLATVFGLGRGHGLGLVARQQMAGHPAGRGSRRLGVLPPAAAVRVRWERSRRGGAPILCGHPRSRGGHRRLGFCLACWFSRRYRAWLWRGAGTTGSPHIPGGACGPIRRLSVQRSPGLAGRGRARRLFVLPVPPEIRGVMRTIWRSSPARSTRRADAAVLWGISNRSSFGLLLVDPGGRAVHLAGGAGRLLRPRAGRHVGGFPAAVSAGCFEEE